MAECAAPRAPLLLSSARPDYHKAQRPRSYPTSWRAGLASAAVLALLVGLHGEVLTNTATISHSALFAKLSQTFPSTGRLQVALHAELTVEALPKPPDGLGYYTRSQAAGIISHMSGRVDWEAWDTAIEESNAPPITAAPPTASEPDRPSPLDRFTVVGGGLFAAVLVLGTALRGLVGREADAASAGPRGDAAVVENGKVPSLRLSDVPCAANIKEKLLTGVSPAQRRTAGPTGIVVGAPPSDGLRLAAAAAGEANAPAFALALPAEAERLPEVTEAAMRLAPCVVLLQVTDSLDMKALAGLLNVADQLRAAHSPVAIVAVASRPDLLPAALQSLFTDIIDVGTKEATSTMQVQLTQAMSATAAEEAAGSSEFWQMVGDAVWDFAVGSKEKKWNPDRRGDNKARVTPQTSSLSWGGLRPVREDYSAATLLAMAEGVRAQTDSRMELARQRVTLEQQTRGAGDQEVLDSRVYMEATVADVPAGPDRVLTGRQLAELCYRKYGCYYDMALLQFKPLGDTMARQIAFNIYGATLGAANFSYSEEQYLEKLELIAQILNKLDQAWYIRKFLNDPIKPRRGLPSTPRADTAVTLRLNTSPTWQYVREATVREYFP